MRERKKVENNQMRKAFGSVDVMIAIGILLGVVVIAYFIRTKVMPSMTARNETMKVNTVLQGVENAKTDYNNGTYVSSSKKAIPDIKKLKLSLGGTKGSASLSGWTYECKSGDDSTIKIITSKYNNTDTRDAVIEAINSKDTQWKAKSKSNSVEIDRKHSVCQ